MTLPSRGLERRLALLGVTERVTGSVEVQGVIGVRWRPSWIPFPYLDLDFKTSLRLNRPVYYSHYHFSRNEVQYKLKAIEIEKKDLPMKCKRK